MPTRKSIKFSRSDLVRFFSKVWVNELTGCWEWTASKNWGGYGRFRYRTNQELLCHVAAYLAFVGDIPNGLELDHLCRVRRCANPAHLEVVTRRENIARGVSKAAYSIRTGMCINGHERSGANLIHRPDGYTECRICRREIYARYRARKRTRSS